MDNKLMINASTPAKFTALLFHNIPVRIHRHTEDNSLWFVAKDICKILRYSNVSYISSKLNSSDVLHHRIVTDGGICVVTWYNMNAVNALLDTYPNRKIVQEITAWILWAQPYVIGTTQNRIIENPVLIERKTLEKIYAVMAELADNYSPV